MSRATARRVLIANRIEYNNIDDLCRALDHHKNNAVIEAAIKTVIKDKMNIVKDKLYQLY